jgi:hypothetical protein
VTLPDDLDWFETGIHTHNPRASGRRRACAPGRGQPAHAGAQASIIIPQGRNGPAFIAYPNFNVLFEWNQSFTYVLTAAYFATRLEGAPVFDTRNPAPRARRQLHAGAAAAACRRAAMTWARSTASWVPEPAMAVRQEQRRLGLPADAWPTFELLNAL